MTTTTAVSLENIQFSYASGTRGSSRREDTGAPNIQPNPHIHQRSQPPQLSLSPISHPPSRAQFLPQRPPAPQPLAHLKHPLPPTPNLPNLTRPISPCSSPERVADQDLDGSLGKARAGNFVVIDRPVAANIIEAQENVDHSMLSDDKQKKNGYANPVVKFEEDDQNAAVICQGSGPGSSKDDPIILDEALAPAETETPQLERQSFDSEADALHTSPPAGILTKKDSEPNQQRSECDSGIPAPTPCQKVDTSSRTQPTSRDTTGAAIRMKHRRPLKQDYPVKGILSSKIVKTKKGDLRLKYEVDWETLWELDENLKGCKMLVKKFHAENPEAPSPADLTKVAKRKTTVPKGRSKKKMRSR